MITNCACRGIINGREQTIKCHRHPDFFETMAKLGCTFDRAHIEQGFIDYDPNSGERFVNRTAAARIAMECGQIKHLEDFNPYCLYSEDLW